MNKYLNDNLILGDSLEFFLGMNYTSQGGEVTWPEVARGVT